MSKHPNSAEPWHDRQAGHKGALGAKPRCHTCKHPKQSCRCQRFDNGPKPKGA
jgi:hypothetical protein